MALARTKSSQTTYSCPFCEYKSKVKGSFESHLHQETGYKTFLCAFCSEDFIKEVELSDHFQKTHCNQKVSFTRRTMPEIEEWIKRLIDFQSSKSYVSLHRYPNKSSSESAVDRYFCSICKRYKRDIVTLKRHIFSHLQYRPYKCIHCSFQAVSASGVRVHTRDTHRKEENDFKVVSITRIDDFVEEIVNYQRPSHFTKTKEKSNEVRDVPASEKLGKKRKEIQVKSIRPSKNIVLKTVSQLGKSVDTLKVRIMKNKSNTDNNNKTCKKQVNKKLPIRKMKTSKKPSLKIKIKKNTQNLFEKEILPKLSTSEPYILEQHTNKKSTKEKLGINKTLKKYGVRKVTLRNYSRMPKNLKLNEHLITCIEEKCKSQLSAVKSAHHEDKKYICVEEEQVSLPQLKFQAPLLNTSSEQKLNNEVVESYCSEHVCDNKHLLPFEGNGRNFESHCIADHDYTMFPENKVMENKFSSQKFTAETNVEEENLQKRLEETGKMYEETFITEQLELMDDYVLLDKQSEYCAEQVNKVEKIERRGFNEKQNMSGEIIQVYIRKLKQKTDENHETKNDNEEWKKQLFEKEYSKASNLLKELNYKRSKLFLEKLNEENEKTKFQNNYEEAFHTSQLEKDYLKNVKGNEESCGMHTQFLCEESKEVRKLENELLAKSKSPKLLTKEHSFDTNHNLDLIGKINKSFGKKTGKTCDKDSSCCKEKTEEHQELMQQLNEPEDEKEGETYPLSEKDQEKEYQYEIIPEKNEEIIDSESKFENSQENVLQFNGKQWKGFKDEVKQKIDNRLKDAVKLHVEEAYMDNQETIKQAVRQQINNKEDITCQNEKGTFSQEPGKECRSESSICKNYLKFENRKQKEKEQQPGKKIKNSEETTKQADSHQIVENEGITFKHEQGKLHEENLENFIKVEDKKENMQIRMAQKTSWNKLRHSYKRDKGVNLMGESDKDINTSTHQDGTSKVKDLFLLNNENSLNNQNCESKEIDLNMIYLELQNEFKDKTEEYYYNTTQRQKVKKVQDDQLTIDGKKSDHHYQKLKKRKVVACQDRFKNKIKKLDCSIQEVPVNCHRKLKHNSEQIVMHGRRLENSGTPKIENRIRFWENDKKKNSAEVNDKSSDRVLYTNRSEVKYSKCKSRRKKTKNEKRIDSFEKLLCGPVHGAGSFTSNSEVKDSKLIEAKKIFSESVNVKFPLKNVPTRSKRNRKPPQCLCCSHSPQENSVKSFKSSQSPACPRIKSDEINKVRYSPPHKNISLTELEQCNICKMCFSNFADLLEHVITEERNVPVSACISAKRIKTTHENETYSSLHFASSKLGVIQNNEEIVSVPGNVLKLESDSECFVTEDPIIPVNLHYSTGKEYDLLDDNLDEGIDNSVQNPLLEGYRKPPVFSSSISQNEQLFCESKTLESIDHCEPERLSESQSNFDEAESTYLKSPVFMDVTDDNLPFSVFEIHPGPHVSPGADTLLTNISHISEAQSIPLSYSMTSTSVSKSPKCLLNNPQYKLKNQDSASFRIPTGDDEDLVDTNAAPNISAFKMYETKLYKCFYCDAGPYSLQKLQQHWQKRHVDAKFFVKNMFLESPVIEYRCSYCMGKEKSLAMVRQHCKHCHPNFPVKFIKTRLVDCVPKSVPWIYEAQKICDL